MNKIEATPGQIEAVKTVMRKLAYYSFAVGILVGLIIGKVIL